MAKKNIDAAGVAQAWIDARFGDVDQLEQDSFRQNVARLMQGEAAEDEFMVARNFHCCESKVHAQMWAVLLEIAAAVKNHKDPPMPREQKTALNALIERLPKESSAHLILCAARKLFGVEFECFAPNDDDLLDAGEYALAAITQIADEGEKAGRLSPGDAEIVSSPRSAVAILLYCFNRFDLVKRYYLIDHRLQNLAQHWRNAHGFGGIAVY